MERWEDGLKGEKASEEPVARRAYTSPELVVHGTVEKITEEQKGGGDTDGGTLANPTRRSR